MEEEPRDESLKEGAAGSGGGEGASSRRSV